jgi:hypothetical protein
MLRGLEAAGVAVPIAWALSGKAGQVEVFLRGLERAEMELSVPG